jgi:hypothetical protein
MNTTLHAVTYEKGRPIHFFMTAGAALAICLQTSVGQWISGHTGAAALPGSLPSAEWLLAPHTVCKQTVWGAMDQRL